MPFWNMLSLAGNQSKKKKELIDRKISKLKDVFNFKK
jgi:hypothetical protein